MHKRRVHVPHAARAQSKIRILDPTTYVHLDHGQDCHGAARTALTEATSLLSLVGLYAIATATLRTQLRTMNFIVRSSSATCLSQLGFYPASAYNYAHYNSLCVVIGVGTHEPNHEETDPQ